MNEKLHLDPAAEQEANDVAAQFMDSSDVVGDMSRAYGRNLSSVRLHTDESAARGAAMRGVDAFSTGKDVFFGRDAFRPNDPASRGLLAHELAHSIQQGVGGGSGTALSQTAPQGAAQGGVIDFFRNLFKRKQKPEDQVMFAKNPAETMGRDIGNFWFNGNTHSKVGDHGSGPRGYLPEYLNNRLGEEEYGNGMTSILRNASGSIQLNGLNASRLSGLLQGSLGGSMSNREVGDMYENLLAGSKINELREVTNKTEAQQAALNAYTPEQIAGMDAKFNLGFEQLKQVYLAQLRRLRDQYGTYGSQMHPEDFISKLGSEFFDQTTLLQDTEQMMKGGGTLFDFENSEDDREFKQLSDYYNDVFSYLQIYACTDPNAQKEGNVFTPDEVGVRTFESVYQNNKAVSLESGVGGPGFSERQQRDYEKRVRKRFGKGSLRLIGRFREK